MLRFVLPLVVLGILVAVLGVGLTMNPRDVPSPLINKPAPAFSLPTLDDPGKTFSRARLTRHTVSLFNVWASWCLSCRQEAAVLQRLARTTDVPIYGLNYKDQRVAAHAWLARFGNPYRAIAYDADGTVGINWGVYGVPETYVVDQHGTIRYKYIGPVTEQAWQNKLRPVIERLRKASG